VLIVDGEDTFTGMLAHQLRALGLSVTVRPWSVPGDLDHDLVVAGPGPGDPSAVDDPKMAALRAVIGARLERGRPLLAVCLGHQILCGMLGLRLHRRDAPYQGLQRTVDLFGATRRVGFYSTFTALSEVDALDCAYGRVELARDPVDGTVHGLRGATFAGLQFHPESVLSQDGVAVLDTLLSHLLSPAPL
jgi:phenazine biosynthesis protein phzE